MRISSREAIELLLEGEIVALPTETVYGLAAALKEVKAVEKIFLRKGRPNNNPLIVHIADISQADKLIKSFPPDADKLMEAFWPGPLTLIVEADSEAVPAVVRANLPTVAMRFPSNRLILEILEQVGPIVMPSANLSGKPSATAAEHVEADFGIDFPVVDGGVSACGLESTILSYDVQTKKWQVARLGAITPEEIEKVLGYCLKLSAADKSGNPLCPGQLFRHYSPEAALYLVENVEQLEAGSMVLGFSDRSYPSHVKVVALGTLSQPESVAIRLYDILRQLDAEAVSKAWIDVSFPREGLWLTILERLMKAAQK